MFAYGQTYLGEWLSQRVAYDIRNQIYDRLQRLSYAYHDQQQTGQLMSRATQDVEAVRWFVSMGVLRGFYIIVLLVGTLVLMMLSNWQLALVVWAFLPLHRLALDGDGADSAAALDAHPGGPGTPDDGPPGGAHRRPRREGIRPRGVRGARSSGERRKRCSTDSYESSRVQAVNAPADVRPLAGGDGRRRCGSAGAR